MVGASFRNPRLALAVTSASSGESPPKDDCHSMLPVTPSVSMNPSPTPPTPDAPSESVAFAKKSNLPLLPQDTPEIVPFELRTMPLGSVLPLRTKVYGEVPPAPVRHAKLA